jgi:4-carboxymuconolactone decarboxylase
LVDSPASRAAGEFYKTSSWVQNIMRLPKLSPEQYSPLQRQLAERISGQRGQVRGPFLCWLHSEELCDRVESLASYIRFKCSIPERLVEFTILIAARFWDAQDSWNAHAGKAVAAGLPSEVVHALAVGQAPEFKVDDERVVYEFCKELLENHFVTDPTFAAAQQLFGDRGLVDLVGCLGNFSMMAFCLNAFQVDLDPRQPPPFAELRGYERISPRKPLG